MGAAPPSEGARCFRIRRAVRGLDCVGGPSRQPRVCGEPLINLAGGCAGYQQTRLQSKSSFSEFFRSARGADTRGGDADGRGARASRGICSTLWNLCAELLEKTPCVESPF